MSRRRTRAVAATLVGLLIASLGSIGAAAAPRPTSTPAGDIVATETSVAALPVATATGSASSDGNPIVIVLDLSGSMTDADAAGTNKLIAAKSSVERVLRQQGEDSIVGVWGYPITGDCEAGSWVVTPGKLSDITTAIATVDTMQAQGGTPTGLALQSAADDLKAGGYDGATIVLISDGESNCDSPPCPVAEELAGTGFDITVDAVGFQQSDSGRDELTCVANATGGQYFDVEDQDELTDRLDELTVARLEMDVRYSSTAVAGGSAQITVSLTNPSSRDAAAVRTNLAFTAAHAGSVMPAVIPPTYSVGNIPAGSTVERTWTVSTGARDTDAEARFQVTAWGSQISAVNVTGAISITTQGVAKDGLSDFLSGVRDAGYPLVIVGDSYSSGEGAEEYLDNDHKCHRSMLTYFAPAFQDDPDQVKIIACSGAVTGDVYFDQQKDRKSISTAQRDQLRDVDGPGAVLLTFGGNDIGFADIITKCIGLGTCSDDEDWVTSVATRIAGLRSVLASTYASLWRAANTDEDVAARDGEYAPLVVLAYPQITHDWTRGSCDNFNVKEVQFTNNLAMALNAQIKAAVADARAEGYEVYFAAPIQAAFLPDNTYCASSAESLVHGIVLSDTQESFHPKAPGYEVETSVLNAWLGSVQRVPPDVAVIAAADEAPFHSLLRRITDSLLTSGSSTSVSSGSTALAIPAATMSVTTTGFAPGSNVSFVLYSSPTTLGTFTADDAGSIDVSLRIPEFVPVGDHTLTVQGFDEDGTFVTQTLAVRVIAPLPDFVMYVALGAILATLLALGLLVWALLRARGRKREAKTFAAQTAQT